MRLSLEPRYLLTAYTAGLFPMADDAGVLHWLAPDPRAILDFDHFRISRSLRSLVQRERFRVTVDRVFHDVIAACGDRGEGTWISPAVRRAYERLHGLGFAHSVETWDGEELAGGLYGVAIGGAFFGESMFHRKTDASKVALVFLVRRLREQGFALLDVQFQTSHLKQFGVTEISRDEYLERLGQAVALDRKFVHDDPQSPPHPDPAEQPST
ncbi:MAG: leucyl/phenylalanyl-tRNA--protein transferase [Planctomycetota bacterium]